jgi:hypothetical protein
MFDEQYHLKGKRMSGRGVRVTMLDPSAHAAVLEEATKMVAADAKVIELKKKEWRIGAKQFITEYTEPCEDHTSPDVKWIKAAPGTMDERFSELFTAKDAAFLENQYRELHEISEAEVEAIAGKALPVSRG